ncbi:MAG: hypothetical protein J6A62_06195, partial [Oscillospiraceae bacterium]|nr:hypothetical protein [Oscillospiraceae bacterium]
MKSMFKRVFSLLLVLVLFIGLLPVQVFAAQEEGAGPDQQADITGALTLQPESGSEQPEQQEEFQTAQGQDDGSDGQTVLEQVQQDIDTILVTYLGTVSAAPEQIDAAVAEMDWETVQTARWEIMLLEESDRVAQLTEDELQILVEHNTVLTAFSDALAENAGDAVTTFASKTVTVLDGKVSITDSAGNGSQSNGTVTIKASGSLFSKATNNITVTNESGSQAKLQFDYAASTYNSFKVAGAAANASGTWSGLLDAGASVALTLESNSGLSNRTATLTLSNFSLTAAAAQSNVTFYYDGALGSVTVGGAAIENGTTQKISLSDGAALVATANSGVRFLGWIDEKDGLVLSTATSYTLTPTEDMAVRAVFVGPDSKPWFGVGGATQKSQDSGLLGMTKIYYYTVGVSSLFDDLNAAAQAAAASASQKTVVLMNDGTLPAGDHTIPAGVTLLVPFDSTNTMFTTQATSISYNDYAQPTAYRNLTLAPGAKLNVNGAISVSAKHCYANGSKLNGGSPTGNVGFITMESGSNITVNNGGALYAYGFITGDGSVVANDGATVYENFQIMDFRGGTQSTDMDNGVFPLSQYYIQNIEVPLTLHCGATEYSYTTIYMSNSDFGSAVAFIGKSGCMFNMADGYVVKRYDGTTDRLIVEAHGTMTMSPISMSVGTSSINSKNYELPINSNITVRVCGGNTISVAQDLALLPGVQIIVEEDATCKLNSGVSLYAYDADDWGGFASPGNKAFIPVTYAPGRTYTRTEADLVDVDVRVDGLMDASAGYVYTTAGGANVHTSGGGKLIIKPGTQTVTYQLVQNTGYTQIPITSAKLKNADGTFFQSTGPVSVYSYADGFWTKKCVECAYNRTTTQTPTCTQTGLETLTCPDCGHTDTAVLAALDHDPVQHEGKAATCLEEGWKAYETCTRCDYTTYEVIDALGHDPVQHEGKAATCLEEGWKAYETCTRCDYTTYEVIDALDHDPVQHEGKAATCLEEGWKAYETCTRCDYTTYEVIDALGHDPVQHDGKAATCLEAGWKAYETCSRCYYTNSEVIDALGHDPVQHEGKAATCLDAGWKAYETCTRCDYTTYEV